MEGLGHLACEQARVLENLGNLVCQEARLLVCPELGVDAIFLQELLVGTIFNYLALVHNYDSVHF